MKRTNQTFPAVAKTMAGLEEILADELNDLGVSNIEILNRAVSFDCTQKQLYAANYLSRTALRILKPIASFTIATEQDFYDELIKISWEKIFTFRNTIAVDATVLSSVFTHSQYVALRCKDAIVDRFRNKYHQRPSVDTQFPDVRINIHLSNNECQVSLDSSGASLHKRGYRKSVSEAPISEVLAAGMILLSGWDRKTDFMDFMCGSGTLTIEAAMIASNIPAAYYREYFGFMKWKDFNEELFEEIKNEAVENIVEPECNIYGSDISENAIQIASHNIRNAKLHKDIQLEVKDFAEQRPKNEKCFIVCNPPYGERIQPDDIIKLYKSIGDTLKQNFVGCEAWIISSAYQALKFVGLKPSSKINLFNGPLECRFVKFEMYEGSRKIREVEE